MKQIKGFKGFKRFKGIKGFKRHKGAAGRAGQLKRKSIRRGLVTFTMCCIICIVLLLSISSIYLTSSSTQQSLTKSLSQSAELASQKITKQIDQFATIAQASALYVQSVDITHVSITKYLREACTQYGITSIDILRADGMSILNGKRYGDDNVYLQAKSGTPFLSDPIIDGDSASFQYGYPINDQIVILKFPYEVIGDIVSDVKIGDTGNTYILNRDGTIIVHTDFSLVQAQENSLLNVKTDSSYKELADLETKMVNGESGFGFYDWDGNEKFGAYTHIEGTNGWSINVTALTSEFMSGVTLAIVISVVLGLVSILVATLAVLRIAGSITRPIEQVAEAVERLSEGDLDIHLDMKRRDEVGLIAERVDDMAKKFKEIISDISCFLEALSHGDLTAESKCDYPGEFQDIRIAMEQITTRLNGTLSVISAAADQVNSSSEQISGAAQGLASGTAEQAAAIEQLNASVESISKQAEKTLDRVNQTTAFVRQISEKMEMGNTRMQSLNDSMSEISTASGKISSITKVIEDIAFQTNILALNAAIEAARAGEAGKGFAVVADEVRDLAAKSAAAAKQTSDLIRNSVNTIASGQILSVETSQTLQETTDQSERIVEAVRDIQTAAREQAQAIDQITQGLTQVSAVVQANAATAEESSASSEEMAAQASTLQREIEQFHLRGTGRQDAGWPVGERVLSPV